MTESKTQLYTGVWRGDAGGLLAGAVLARIFVVSGKFDSAGGGLFRRVHSFRGF